MLFLMKKQLKLVKRSNLGIHQKVFLCMDLKIIDGKLNLDDFPSEIENWDDLKLDKSTQNLKNHVNVNYVLKKIK